MINQPENRNEKASMKEYQLFCGHTGSFYGGAMNFQGSFDSIEEAKANHDREHGREVDWLAHIATGRIFIKSYYRPAIGWTDF